MAQLVERLPSTRTSRVLVLPEAALLFLLGKQRGVVLGIVALLCLVSITEHTCCSFQFLSTMHIPFLHMQSPEMDNISTIDLTSLKMLACDNAHQ